MEILTFPALSCRSTTEKAFKSIFVRWSGGVRGTVLMKAFPESETTIFVQTSPSNLTSANELKSSIVINLRCALHSGRQRSAKKFARMMDSSSVVCRSEITFFLLSKKFNLRTGKIFLSVRCLGEADEITALRKELICWRVKQVQTAPQTPRAIQITFADKHSSKACRILQERLESCNLMIKQDAWVNGSEMSCPPPFSCTIGMC